VYPSRPAEECRQITGRIRQRLPGLFIAGQEDSGEDTRTGTWDACVPRTIPVLSGSDLWLPVASRHLITNVCSTLVFDS